MSRRWKGRVSTTRGGARARSPSGRGGRVSVRSARLLARTGGLNDAARNSGSGLGVTNRNCAAEAADALRDGVSPT